jgi:hypothetical protein
MSSRNLEKLSFFLCNLHHEDIYRYLDNDIDGLVYLKMFLSVYILISFDFPFVRLSGVR